MLPTHLCRFTVRGRCDVTLTLFLADQSPAWAGPCGLACVLRHAHNRITCRLVTSVMLRIITSSCWNINQLSITYAFRPRLRTDSPWVDLRCPGNLGFTARGVLTRGCATYTYILTSVHSTVARAICFDAHGTLRYHSSRLTAGRILSFGTMLKPRYIFGAPRLDQ